MPLTVLRLVVSQIIIRATKTQEVLGEKGRRIRELTALVQKRFKFPENSLELYAEKVQYRGLSAIAQCESLKNKLLGGLAVRRCELRSSFDLNLLTKTFSCTGHAIASSAS